MPNEPRTGPLVSIVTPSYNQGQFIERTILSVREQRYRNVEHIVIDGGSTDGTIELLRSYENTYNLRWLSEADSGMYEAINKGLSMATGTILAYLNSDDYYLPWTIARIVAEFAKTPAAGAVFGDILRFQEETGRGQLLLLPHPWTGMFQRSGCLAQPALFWRAEVTARIGAFDAGLRYVGDCDYWMRIGPRFSLKHVREVLAVDSLHAGSKRSNDPDGVFSELQMIRQRYQPASVKRRILRAVDRAYSAFFAEYNLSRFAAALLLRSRLGIQPGRNSWPSLISESPFPMSRSRFLTGFVPVVRALSLGSFRQVPIYRQDQLPERPGVNGAATTATLHA